MEHRAFEFEVRQTDSESGAFSGYANVFGNVDSFDSSFQQGAFSKTIQEHNGRFPVLWFHNPTAPIGMGDFSEDEHGLFVEGFVDVDTERGRDVLSGMRKGYIDQMSIGFNALRDEIQDDIRIIKEARLFEGSLLTRNFAANDLALVTDVRSMPGMIEHIVSMSGRDDIDPGELRSEIEKLHAVLDRYMAPTHTPPEQRAVPEFQDFPLASREREWDGDAAVQRLQVWASEDDSGDPDTIDWTEYRKGFLMYDPDNAEQIGGYKMPIADVVGGDIQAVPRGIFAAAGVLEGAMGGVEPFEDGDMDAARSHLERYYAKMRDEFDDDEIVAPWNEENSLSLDDIWNVIQDDNEMRSEVAKLCELAAPSGDPGTRPASTPIADDHLDALSSELEQLSKQLEGSVQT